MKKLIILTITSFIGSISMAQAIKTTAADQIYGSGQGRTSSGRPMITTDANTVYGMGRNSQDAVAKFTLESGHYILGDDTNEGFERNETHSLFVNPSANDPDKYVALYIENDVFRNETGLAQIMIGAPTNDGRAIQFAPARIGLNGNIEDTSNSSTHARVLLISKKLDSKNERYPYLVKGLNGETNSRLLGMRGAVSNMNLRAQPLRNTFHWENNRRNKVVVDGASMTEYKPGVGQDEL
jgi:hypothetical protein